jgi:peptide/nickel transport system permease protein
MTRTLKFIGRRLLHAVIVIACVVVIDFSLLHFAPGDAVDALAGEAGASDAAYLASLREKYGLDQPYHVQLARYVWAVLHLDLGYSFRHAMPVLDLILGRLTATLLLMLGSLVLAFVAGVVLGALAAGRPGSTVDRAVMVGSLLAYATPLFWLGLMLIVLFSLHLQWLPSHGMETIGVPLGPLERALDVLRHMVLPVVTLSLFYMATYIRLMRASMLETYGADFVRTARAKGLSETRISYRHVLRNAILPILTLFGMQVGSLLGGAVVVEVVFGWPGLGRLAFEAIFERDFNLMLAILLLTTLTVVIVNVVVDLLYAWLDPRIEMT